MTVWHNSHHLHFFQPITGQQTSRNIKAVMWLVERSVDGRNFVLPAYTCKLVFLKKLRWSGLNWRFFNFSVQEFRHHRNSSIYFVHNSNRNSDQKSRRLQLIIYDSNKFGKEFNQTAEFFVVAELHWFGAHSANFDEKVHKPQSKSYGRIGANMQLIFTHILWIWILLSVHHNFWGSEGLPRDPYWCIKPI